MDEMSINIQQLPITMLKAIVSDLNIDEQLVLANVNRYFYSIVSPILYKDILFWDYNVEHFKEKVTEEYYQELEIAMSELDINDELDYETIQAEIERDLNEEIVVKKVNEFRQKQWSELEPVIKKHHKLIFASQCINSNNLIAELENYSNLKWYKLKIDTQEGIEQLKIYKGDRFKLMERLELTIYDDAKFEVEDLFLHLLYLKALHTDMGLFHNDLKRFSGFSSNTLTFLSIESLKKISTELLYIIQRNFKNLEYLNISLTRISWASKLTELSIFENLKYLYFLVYNHFDPNFSSYLSNAKFWPKLEVLNGSYYNFNGTVKFEGQWNNLTSLTTYKINFTSLNKWNNFNQLQELNLTMHPRTDSKMVKTIFTNLTKLIAFKLYGDISSQHFDFVPHIQLRSLYILNLIDFSQPFINFVKALLTIKELSLYFTDSAFEGVNLNSLLEEKHIFSNLKYINLDDLPQQLQKWFSYSINL